MRKLYLLIFVILIGLGCKKDEGTGGTSTIEGRVKVQSYYRSPTDLVEEYYAQEEDIYIIYGDDKIYSDRVRTDYNGYYKFEYLQKGNYTIYAYSIDSANYYIPGTALGSKNKIAIKSEVKITKNHQTVTAPEIVIKKVEKYN